MKKKKTTYTTFIFDKKPVQVPEGGWVHHVLSVRVTLTPTKDGIEVTYKDIHEYSISR